MNAKTPFDSLWKYVEDNFQCDPLSFHGVNHWKRVSRNGRILTTRTGANSTVVELFALFHDSCRWTEGVDPGHGSRGAELAKRLRGDLFELSDEELDLLYYACTWHQERDFHENITIGTCWDADRLDLGRVGITPDPQLLNTEFAKQLANEPNLEHVLSDLDSGICENER